MKEDPVSLLSTRARNVLRGLGIFTFSELDAAIEDGRLKAEYNCGRVSYREIIEWRRLYGPSPLPTTVNARAAVNNAVDAEANSEDLPSVRHQVLAESLEMLTERDLCELAGIEAGTADSWRKRKKGPSYSLIGNRYLYARADVLSWIECCRREIAPTTPAKDLL